MGEDDEYHYEKDGYQYVFVYALPHMISFLQGIIRDNLLDIWIF